MKKITIILAAAVAVVGCKSNNEPLQLSEKNIDKIVAAMTLEEKANLVVGQGMSGFTANIGNTQDLVPGAAGTTYPLDRLGIPKVVLADGPAGLRISPVRRDDENTYYCTGFPVGTLLACSWNTELVNEVGTAMGHEVKEYGVDVILGPAVNIHRNPLCGRNFEYYSEDPYLTGKTAASMIKGIQSNNVGVSIKHFAVNNQETNRFHLNSIVSPRAIREIYLKGFEIAVKDSDPWTIMSSYPYINGVYASESRELLHDIARDEWGFKGMVMTDWSGGSNPPAQIHAGNDLLMPGNPKQVEAIIGAVKDGSLDENDLNWCVSNILRLIVRTPHFKGYQYSNKPDLEANAKVTRRSAAEGMVLLKNDNCALPLSQTTKNIALFGITSYDFLAGGTGSGDVNKAYVVDLRQGLNNAGYKLDKGVDKYYSEYIKDENEKALAKIDKSNPFWKFMPIPRVVDIVPPQKVLRAAAKDADAAIITIGRNAGEGADRNLEGDFLLTDGEKALITNVANAFSAMGKKSIVVLNIGGVIETASWKEMPDAILLAWQAGQEGGNTVADVLKGVVNPSGKLSMTFPVNYMDHASSKNFPWDFKVKPEEKFVLFMGGVPETDEPRPRRNIDETTYEEDIYVGYRWFDTFGLDVSYPFGYGLSYTTFDYSNPALKCKRGAYTAEITVTNTGTVAGKEVVELYVAAPECAAGRPSHELKAYAKTKLLAPNESQTLVMQFDADDLARYDAGVVAWVVDKGDYAAQFAASSRDVRQSVPFTIKRDKVTQKTHASMLPNRDIEVLHP